MSNSNLSVDQQQDNNSSLTSPPSNLKGMNIYPKKEKKSYPTIEKGYSPEKKPTTQPSLNQPTPTQYIDRTKINDPHLQRMMKAYINPIHMKYQNMMPSFMSQVDRNLISALIQIFTMNTLRFTVMIQQLLYSNITVGNNGELKLTEDLLKPGDSLMDILEKVTSGELNDMVNPRLRSIATDTYILQGLFEQTMEQLGNSGQLTNHIRKQIMGIAKRHKK